MALPGDLSTVTVTGTFLAAGGAPLLGSVTLTPSANLTDVTGEVVVWAVPECFRLSSGILTAGPVAATDNAGLSPAGFTYAITVDIQGTPLYTFSTFLPSSPSTVDFTALVPVAPQAGMSPYLLTSGGTLTGPLTLSDGLTIPPGAAVGYVWTSDGAGNGSWQRGGETGFTHSFTALSVVTVAHGLGRNPAVTVIDSADDVCTGDVRYLDADTVRLTFSAPFTGTAICT